MNKITFTSLIIYLSLSINLYAQDPPVNDDCSGAIDIQLGNQVLSSLDNATDSGISSSCDMNTSDVWYQFTTPASGEVYINLDGGGLLAYTITEDCATNNVVACGNEEETFVNSLNGNTSYLIFIEKVTLACRGDCDLEFALTISEQTLSINNFDEAPVLYYPNPVKNELIIYSKGIITRVDVFNVLGKKIETTKANAFEAFKVIK